ncbi:Demethylsterigmatocystin 6-O-methyltransferase [Daldinia childiae]|uniref:Demethylsterigmatocystin 6-O-methyltransferase n=1 Tax=Daldinia childiae TaxID=326645 RepID=UPI0014473365|nr:Demethylsterigmatocystin 6-O-methyltransferase [Daldinia childiae]KAF3055270.1 Demethylsterigmatocystin 6-O-methyltransferase [Daldinia childiae]
MDSTQVTLLITQLSSLSPRLSNDDDNSRKEALNISRSLIKALEKSENLALELAFSPLITVSANIAIDLDLFKLIVKHGPVGSRELESLSGGEELLIVRILRPLASIGFVDKVSERVWEPTSVTRAMTTEWIGVGHRTIKVIARGATHKVPDCFREVGYYCPTDPRDGLVQYTYQTSLSLFQYLATVPRMSNDFNLFMGSTMGARSYWVNWYSVEERLLKGATQDTVLLVDVGAGEGHDTLAFHARYPNQGRLILQDIVPLFDSIQAMDGAIECMTYNFFTAQPVAGARAYFYHHILHDWSNTMCLEILKQVRAAMTPGYSKLLLHEMIIPEKGASTSHAVLDLTMMVANAGMERTESRWWALLENAGLQIVKVWPASEEDADGIIEAMLPE